MKLPIKVEMLVSKIITTPSTDNPLFPIFLSKVSTLDKRSVVIIKNIFIFFLKYFWLRILLKRNNF